MAAFQGFVLIAMLALTFLLGAEYGFTHILVPSKDLVAVALIAAPIKLAFTAVFVFSREPTRISGVRSVVRVVVAPFIEDAAFAAALIAYGTELQWFVIVPSVLLFGFAHEGNIFYKIYHSLSRTAYVVIGVGLGWVAGLLVHMLNNYIVVVREKQWLYQDD